MLITPGGRGRGGGRAAIEPVQSNLGRILCGVGEVLAVVPESSVQDFPVNGDLAGPRCASATPVGDDLENRGLDLALSAGSFKSIFPGVGRLLLGARAGAALERHCFGIVLLLEECPGSVYGRFVGVLQGK